MKQVYFLSLKSLPYLFQNKESDLNVVSVVIQPSVCYSYEEFAFAIDTEIHTIYKYTMRETYFIAFI